MENIRNNSKEMERSNAKKMKLGFFMLIGIIFISIVSASTSIKEVTSDELGIFTAGSEKVRVDSSGNVGIGTTSPASNLDVSDDMAASGAEQIRITGYTNSNQQLRIGYQTTLDYGVIQAIKEGMAYQNLVLSPNGGNVGIGTTSPSAKLDIVDSSNPQIRLSHTSGSVYTELKTDSDGYLNIVPSGNITYIGDAPVYDTAGYTFTVKDSDTAFALNVDAPSDSLSGRAFSIGQNGESYARMVYYSNSFLGIGPGNSTRDTFIGRSDTNTLRIGSLYDGTGTGHLIVNGNVGIGTTSPSTKLQLKGDSTYITVEALDGSEGVRLGTASAGKGVLYLKDTGGGNAIYLDGDGDSYFNTGNIGIGTTSPTVKLTLNNNGGTDYSLFSTAFDMAFGISANTTKITGMDFKNFESTGQTRLMARNDDDDYISMNAMGTGSTASFFGQNGNQLTLFGYGKRMAIGTYQSNELVFGTGNTERMRIDTSGNVGIGTTSPTSNLHIQAASGENAEIRMVADAGEDSQDTWKILIDGTGLKFTDVYGRLPLFLGYNSNIAINTGGDAGDQFTVDTNTLVVDGGGNVGIGTTAPKTALEVSSVIKSTPTDAPGTCNTDLEGGMYYDASLNEPCFCDGTNWNQFDGGGTC